MKRFMILLGLTLMFGFSVVAAEPIPSYDDVGVFDHQAIPDAGAAYDYHFATLVLRTNEHGQYLSRNFQRVLEVNPQMNADPIISEYEDLHIDPGRGNIQAFLADILWETKWTYHSNSDLSFWHIDPGLCSNEKVTV